MQQFLTTIRPEHVLMLSVNATVRNIMPHINFNNDLPGIRSALAYRPEAARHLGQLADVLLRDTNGLSRRDRELIGMHVSELNDCFYCSRSHAEIACIYSGNDNELIDHVKNDYLSAPVSDKLKALLTIAGKVQKSGKAVTPEDIAAARLHGASDMDIHDTVLIAALFCLFNRYVDGLDMFTPRDLASYQGRAQQVAENGYAGIALQKK